MATRSKVNVVVIGAGAAGIGAAKTLAQRGLSFTVVEGSHRIGGRAYTEDMAPGEPFDLGCHWLHSGSVNPMVAIADQLGFAYRNEDWHSPTFRGGCWLPAAASKAQEELADETYRTMCRLADQGKDLSIYECIDRDYPWAEMLDYWYSLETSADTDQVSMLDLVHYHDTDENWPVRDGYGSLLATLAADIPVELNCAVEALAWNGGRVGVQTAKGKIECDAVIVTVSNNVLGANDIEFKPRLPDWKLEAIAAVPLGNHNRICLRFDGDVFGDLPAGGASYSDSAGKNLSFQIRPFGFNHAIGVTGGRFADWLERAGTQASVGYVLESVVKMFGSEISKHLIGHKVTAWRSDPWVKGAYSACQPGHYHQRARLGESLGGCLYFAGEATSTEFYTTAHGAYLTGISTANDVADRLSASS